jgi:hypothetical protein
MAINLNNHFLNINNKKIAFVKKEPFHDEILYSFVSILKNINNMITIYSNNIDNFYYNNYKSFAIVKKYDDLKKDFNNYDILIFSSKNSEKIINSEWLINNKNKLYFIYHHIKLTSSLKNSYIKNIIFLNKIVYDDFIFISKNNNLYNKFIVNLNKKINIDYKSDILNFDKNKIYILMIGASYNRFLTYVRNYLEKNNNNNNNIIFIICSNNINMNKKYKISKEIKIFKNISSYNLHYIVSKCDYILAPLEYKMYLKNNSKTDLERPRCSGMFNLALQYDKPLILDEQYKMYFNDNNNIFINSNNISNIFGNINNIFINVDNYNIVNYFDIGKYEFNYPILYTNNFIDNTFYVLLKNNFPKFNYYNTTYFKREDCNNIFIKYNNDNYIKLNKYYKKLFNILNSQPFINFILKKFDIENAKKNGFIGNINNIEFEMNICESTNNYTQKWNVNSRRSIIHFIIYVGTNNIKNGGEFSFAKHINLNNNLDYIQYPILKNLIDIKFIQPKDNVGIFILSQNNSYHMINKIIGSCRFLYCSYNNKDGDAWINNKKYDKNIF